MGSVTARTAGAGLALCIGALCANDALGQSQPSTGRLGKMLFEQGDGRRQAAPPVARYVAEGSVAFILDRSSAQPLIRFEGSNEVWVLTPQPGPKPGDIIFKNDVGETVLRLWRLGGLTVFTSTRPEGAAAVLDGVGPTLRQAFADAGRTGVLLQAASGKVSTAAGRQIGIYADEVDGRNAGVTVDAANVAAEAFVSLSKSRRNASALARISDIVLVVGKKASVAVNQRSLVITVVPGKGVSGRPSSARIIQELRG